MTEADDDLVERLRARTFSRWESDIQAIAEYTDDLATEAADALAAERQRVAELEEALTAIGEFPITNTLENQDAVNMSLIALRILQARFVKAIP